jgi:uncharacterized delta-60 repeat protein
VLERLEDRRLLRAGALDESFGLTGVYSFLGGEIGLSQNVYASATAMDANGNFIIAGGGSDGVAFYGLVVRVKSDGYFDYRFNATGYVELGPNTYFYGVAIQSDGKIVAAGDSLAGNGQRSIVVARLNPDGSYDNSFGVSGVVTYSDTQDQGSIRGNALAIQSDGKIVVAGSDAFGGSTYFSVVRLNTDGTVDNSFEYSNLGTLAGQVGLVLTAFPMQGGGSDAKALTVAIAPDGTIAAAGYANLQSGITQRAFAIALYNPDGLPDLDFNSVGRDTNYLGLSVEQATGIAFQNDGNIVVGGFNWDDQSFSEFALIRYQPNGTLDSGFGNSGVVFTSFTNGTQFDSAYALAFQADGKIVVGGYSDGGPSFGFGNFALARYNPNGSLDSSFNFDGEVTTDLYFEQKDIADALAIQPDGKIVLVGDTTFSSGADAISIARYDGDSGVLQFSAPSGSIPESAAIATLTVTRGDGGTGPVTVDYTTSDGTATAGADYTSTSGTLVFQDGQTSQTISVPILDNGAFEGGYETFDVTLANPQGGATLGSQTATAVTIQDTDVIPVPIGFMEGQSFTTTVAIFRDWNPTFNASEFSASIAWGDNTTTPGTITPDPNGGFDIAGTHTYAEEGSYIPVISVTGADNLSVNSQATVADAPLTGKSMKLVVTGQKNFSGAVATFTDADPGAMAGDYTATITWDDGTSSRGTVTGTGPFTVSGTHLFGSFTGTHHISITIGDAGSSVTVTDNVIDPTLNELYVMQLYQQLLQRSADSGGLAYWSGLLDQGASRTQVALDIEQSQECRQDEVQALYAHYLFRNADASGLAAFTNLLTQGGTLEQAAAGIVASPEYFQVRGGGTNAGFLSALYQDALGRAIDPSGQAFFGNQLAAGASRGQVASAIFASAEYRQDIVQGYYLSILGRSADKTGLAIFTSTLAGGKSDEEVIADIFGSDEFFANL